jgi:hypothetical protein
LGQKMPNAEIALEAGKCFSHSRCIASLGADVAEFALGATHVKVGCKLAIFGAVSRAAITASTVIDAIRIINNDTGQVAP